MGEIDASALDPSMKGAESADCVFADDDGVGLDVDHLATQPRDYLKLRAEVDRTKLFNGSKNRMRLRAHDLRATWIAQQQGDLAPMHLTIPELAELAESIAPRRWIQLRAAIAQTCGSAREGT